MVKWIVFGVLSIGIILISWRTLFDVRSHGFYRFIGWELLLWLIINNINYWFVNPLSINQIFSWVLLVLSLFMLIAGVILVKNIGKPSDTRDEKNLYSFEKTSQLIDTGVYKYIRHPLYASLMYLTWGTFLKNPTLMSLVITVMASGFFYVTMIFDEKECIDYFGDKYRQYMKRSKMFIPLIY